MPWGPSRPFCQATGEQGTCPGGDGGTSSRSTASLLHPSGNLQQYLTVTPELFLWTVGLNQRFREGPNSGRGPWLQLQLLSFSCNLKAANGWAWPRTQIYLQT